MKLSLGFGVESQEVEIADSQIIGILEVNEVRSVDSDSNDCVRMGVTKAGTPVDIIRQITVK
ncbi:MAG: hypothetical protein PHY91_05645 [Tissierellia bacterium]|nr:hypothetical protein [Tissierellia bacterium]